jgi:prephenate dehydrogenase
MWADIFSSNSSNLIEGAKIFSENMDKIIDLFKDTESLETLLSEIRNKKKDL